jgi:hypothetical protein
MASCKPCCDHVLNMSTSLQDSSLETNRSYSVCKVSRRGHDAPWPDKTDVLCWHCCHAFDGPPVGIPIDDNQHLYRLVGNFCSFNCAYAYALGDGNHITDYAAGCRLKVMAHTLFDIDPVSIRAAPDRLCLDAFGGCMTIDEFRANFNKVSVMAEPFVSTHMLLCAQQREDLPSEQKLSSKPESFAQEAQNSRFKVTGLRKPDVPLPTNKVLCEQDVTLDDGLYARFLSEKGHANNFVISKGTGCAAPSSLSAKASGDSTLHRFVKKKKLPQ